VTKKFQLHSLFTLVDTVGILILATTYFKLWLMPELSDANAIYTLCVLIAFEFFMVHSSLFMSSVNRKSLNSVLLLVVPFYGIFAVIFNFFVDNNAVMILYLLVVFNRIQSGLTQPENSPVNLTMLRSTLTILIYFFLLIAIVVLSDSIPELGVSNEYLTASEYHTTVKKHGGLLLDVPKIGLCLGTAYFSLLFLLEISFLKWKLADHTHI